MKLGSKISILLLAICQIGWAQGFANLDFEHPNLPLAPVGGYLSPTNAIPNWAPSLGIIGYNSVSIGGALIALEDTNAPSGVPLPIQGNYSVLLQGSIPFAGTPASIGQTGTIPNTAQSLTFFGDVAGNLQLTFEGQPLSFMAISNTLNYTIYGADISSYAGQTGQLLFTAQVQTYALLDNIQFSSIPIPEPGALDFAALGALILGFHFRRNRPS